MEFEKPENEVGLGYKLTLPDPVADFVKPLFDKAQAITTQIADLSEIALKCKKDAWKAIHEYCPELNEFDVTYNTENNEVLVGGNKEESYAKKVRRLLKSISTVPGENKTGDGTSV